MNPNESPAQKMVSKISRLTPSDDAKRASALAPERQESKTLFLKSEYRPVVSWIAAHNSARQGTTDECRSLRVYGIALAKSPLDISTIRRLIDDPIFRDSRLGQTCLAGRSPVDVVNEIHRIAHFTSDQLDAYLQETFHVKSVSTQTARENEEWRDLAQNNGRKDTTVSR